MELTDLKSSERWKQLAEVIYGRFGLNGGYFIKTQHCFIPQQDGLIRYVLL